MLGMLAYRYASCYLQHSIANHSILCMIFYVSFFLLLSSTTIRRGAERREAEFEEST